MPGIDVASQPPAPDPAPSAAAQPSTASGSGFLFRQTNLVLTSFHVVRDRKELTVRFPSGEEYRGRVVAQDRGNDLALVEAQGLTPSSRGAVVATTVGIRIGEPIHALGQVIGVAAAGLVREGVEAVRFGIKASTPGMILPQAQVTTAFDVVVSPLAAGPRPPDQIFGELAPAVVLIETR